MSVIAIPAMFFLSIRPGFTKLSDHLGNNLLQMWANFDGFHYLDQATTNYFPVGETSLTTAYFPVYPWLVRNLNDFVHNPLITGLIISNLAFFLSLLLLYKLFLLDYKEKISRFALLLIFLFPTSFIFGSIYPHSILLLLSLLTFFFVRKNNFFLSGIFAMIASATCLVGIFLWPALIIEYFQTNGTKIKQILKPSLVWLSLPPIGLLAYIRFLSLHSGNAVTLLPSLVEKKLILLHQILYRYFTMVLHMDHTDPLFFTVLLELFSGLLLIYFLIFSFKKIRRSYWLYCLLSFLLPTLTGTFAGLPKIALVLFPMFGFLASTLDKTHPYLRYLYFLVTIIFSIFAISLFTRGYFVA